MYPCVPLCPFTYLTSHPCTHLSTLVLQPVSAHLSLTLYPTLPLTYPPPPVSPTLPLTFPFTYPPPPMSHCLHYPPQHQVTSLSFLYVQVIHFNSPYIIPPSSQWHKPFAIQFLPTLPECMFNTTLRLSTNASYFNIPLYCYDGRVTVSYDGRVTMGMMGG